MKHAAHRSTVVSKRPGKHVSAVAPSSATITLQEAVIREVNQMPRTRRERRQAERARVRKNRFNLSGAVTLLFGTVGTAVVVTAASTNTDLFNHAVAVAQAADSSTLSTSISSNTAVSRSTERSARTELTTETASVDTSQAVEWNVQDGATSIDVSNLTAISHPTGDTGLAYEFSQCTWWAYTRRHQLGLPVGSHFGNGGQWAASARALGYSVDNKPQVGDIVVFAPGQEGSDATYGHVAIVEKVNADGSIVTSECGAVMQGKIYSRTIKNTSQLQFIHE